MSSDVMANVNLILPKKGFLSSETVFLSSETVAVIAIQQAQPSNCVSDSPWV